LPAGRWAWTSLCNPAVPFSRISCALPWQVAEKRHPLRCPHPASLRRTYMYASSGFRTLPRIAGFRKLKLLIWTFFSNLLAKTFSAACDRGCDILCYLRVLRNDFLQTLQHSVQKTQRIASGFPQTPKPRDSASLSHPFLTTCNFDSTPPEIGISGLVRSAISGQRKAWQNFMLG